MKRKIISILACLFLWCWGGFSTPSHPHLFFSKKDLPTIRERVKRGTPKRAWFFLKERCQKHLNLKKLPPSTDIDTSLDPLSELALAWQISESDEYKKKFLDLLKNAREAKTDLAKLNYETAMIFDWGYNIMSDADREYVKKFLLDARKNQEQAYKCYWYPFSNWGLIPGMAGLRQAAVLYGHPEYDPKLLDNAAELARNCFRCFIDDSGYPSEGGNYFDYPFGRIGGASVFIMKRKGYNFLDETNLSKIPEYLLKAGIPQAEAPSYFPFGDSGYATPGPYTLRLLLNLMPDNLPLHHLATLSEIEREHKPDPLSGIFYYVPVKATKDSTKTFEKATFNPESGIATFKDGSGPDAFFVATTIRQGRGHTHEDIGSFIIRAYGIDWLTDPGYGEKSLLQHNMVSIDNDSPESSGAPGYVRQALLTSSGMVISVDLTRFWNFYRPPGQPSPLLHADYPVQSAHRSLIVTTGSEKLKRPPYVIVSDYVKRDNRNHLYSQLFQTPPDQKVSLSEHGALLTQNTSQMRLAVLTPQEATMSSNEWTTYGRFAGRKFLCVKAEVTGRYGRFVTILYPHREGMPDMKLIPSKGLARWRIDWEKSGTDYIDYSTPDQTKHYDLLLWRTQAGEPINAAPTEYILVNASSSIKLGKRELSNISACHVGRTSGQFLYSLFLAGEELRVDVYNNPFNERDIQHLVKIKAFAPGVRRVWLNGTERVFESEGDSVTVTGYTRPSDEYHRVLDRKWQKLSKRQNEIRGDKPSPTISGDAK